MTSESPNRATPDLLTEVFPDGWTLRSRVDGPEGTALRLERDHSAMTGRHRIAANGPTYEMALVSARRRIKRYDASDGS